MIELTHSILNVIFAVILLVVIAGLMYWAENHETDKRLACEHLGMVYVNPNGGDGYCTKGVRL